MSDLVADLSAELAAPRPVAAAAAGAGPRGVGRAAGAARGEAPVRRVPALAVVFTPLHWARPSVGAPATGAGVVLRGGPWQVDVQL